MRIRKNANISALLYATNGGHESPSLIQNKNNNLNLICELNQSPWDIINTSSSSFHQLDDYVINYNVNISGNTRWFDSIADFKSAASKISGLLDEKDNVNGRDDDLGGNDDVSCDESLGVISNEEIKELEGESCDDGEIIELCGETDEEGWQCGNVVQNGYTMCQYHLSEDLQTSYVAQTNKKKFGAYSGSGPTSECRSRRAKKRTKPNPHDFYYYSGFGPSWAKKRGTTISDTDLSGVDGNVDVQKEKGRRFEPRPVKVDYMDGYDDDDYSDDDKKSEVRILGRKKGRKPVKERSLKSLM